MSRFPVARLVLFTAITAVTLAADLSSKAIVFHDLGYPGGARFAFTRGTHLIFAAPTGREGESVPYLNGWMTFRFLTSFNPGALWGLGQQFTWLFTLLSLLAVVAIPIWLFVFQGVQSRWLTCALAIISGGTLGNLYDRVGLPGYTNLNGGTIKAVRDFLLFTFGSFHWPVFNVADVCLVTGALMLVLHSLAAAQPHATSESERSSSATHSPSGPGRAPEKDAPEKDTPKKDITEKSGVIAGNSQSTGT
jgi:signal peptidase II